MRHRIIYVVLALVVLALCGTSCSHRADEMLFPADVAEQSRADLNAKLAELGLPNPLQALDTMGVSDEERRAMEFLYAYMTTPDILDYSVDFHLENVRTSLRARAEMPWGSSVPPLLFRHFVLPLRANNEALDDVRTVLYEELKKEVEGKSMYDAVLALNHWCHRHVTYAPSDARTSSPLATMRNALGRCGEESTFTVAILRTMGIPARQVYTPRWAHTDDNHAWVEAWVDGTWHYLGACEPAPKLDMAWFDAPVLRAMLLHAKAFGRYSGNEESLSEHPVYTEINVTSNYVPVVKAKVRVVDAEGTPLRGIPVTFRLYNYAELYPLVSRTTDAEGMASAELGLGDIVIVAGDSRERMGILHYTVRPDAEVVDLPLRSYDEWDDTTHFRLVPPVERTPDVSVDSLAAATCNNTMMYNDSVRNAYTATFATPEMAHAFADELGLADAKETTEMLSSILVESRGNQAVIRAFLSETEPGKRVQALHLLSSLSPKDLHDVTLDVLRDAIDEEYTESEVRDPNVISLRVDRERLYPVMAQLKGALAEIIAEKGDKATWDALSRAEKVRAITSKVETFKVDRTYNPLRNPLSPATVWQYRVGDQRSLNVLLIRLLRTARIPAEWDSVPDKAVYYDEEGRKVIIPFFEAETDVAAPDSSCRLLLSYTREGYLKEPKYNTNFTVGYIGMDGQMGTYGFGYGDPYFMLKDEELIYSKNFISTGTRLADGTVLYNMSKVRCGEVSPLLFDRDTTSISVIGGMNPEALYFDLTQGVEKSILSTTGRGYFVLIIGQAHHEPTDHILRDMQVLYAGDVPQVPVIAMTVGDAVPADAMRALLPQAYWGRDTSGILEMLQAGCQIEQRMSLPVVAVCDTFGRTVHISQGYTIGSGHRIAEVISAVK